MHKSIANTAKWDTPRPLELPSLVTIEEEAETIEEFGQEMVIQVALDEYDGHLKGAEIWKFLNRPDVSRNKVYDTIKRMVAQGTVEYKGVKYGFKQIRNRYQLTSLPTSH